MLPLIPQLLTEVHRLTVDVGSWGKPFLMYHVPGIIDISLPLNLPKASFGVIGKISTLSFESSVELRRCWSTSGRSDVSNTSTVCNMGTNDLSVLFVRNECEPPL